MWIVPMRDGNTRSAFLPQSVPRVDCPYEGWKPECRGEPKAGTGVWIVPMRDGNPYLLSLHSRELHVWIVPMRDGNLATVPLTPTTVPRVDCPYEGWKQLNGKGINSRPACGLSL